MRGWHVGIRTLNSSLTGKRVTKLNSTCQNGCGSGSRTRESWLMRPAWILILPAKNGGSGEIRTLILPGCKPGAVPIEATDPFKLVWAGGFEPPISWSQATRIARLSYTQLNDFGLRNADCGLKSVVIRQFMIPQSALRNPQWCSRKDSNL